MDEVLTPSVVVQVLIRTQGNRSEAARQLNVSRTTLVRYEENYPEITEAILSEREALVDLAENKLRDKLEKAHWPAIQFTLSTIGRRRGYGPVGTAHLDLPGDKGTIDVDLSDPEVRKLALAFTDALASAASDDGLAPDPGEMGDGTALALAEPQDQRDPRSTNSPDSDDASSTREVGTVLDVDAVLVSD